MLFVDVHCFADGSLNFDIVAVVGALADVDVVVRDVLCAVAVVVGDVKVVAASHGFLCPIA